MALLLEWIKRIVKIGFFEFLSKIGLKTVVYLVAALVLAIVIIAVLIAVIIAILV